MKRPKFKYPGDSAMERFLRKHQCPTPLPVVRMRFLGEIASLDFGASPAKTVESFWDGDLPVFESEQEASNFFNTMLGLWNRMARHQDGVLVKLTKPKKLRDRGDVIAAMQMRSAEIRDGFLAGFGETNDKLLPPALQEAIHGLKEFAGRFDAAAERIQGPQRDEDGQSLDDYRQVVEARTKEIETLLTVVVRATKELRRLGIAAMDEVDDEPFLH
jgi:hypothetical protein